MDVSHGSARLGGMNRTDIAASDCYIPCENSYHIRLFDDIRSNFDKIYCSCGRIVDLDSGSIRLKRALKKPITCSHCRNLRIAAELDALDANYSVIESCELY